ANVLVEEAVLIGLGAIFAAACVAAKALGLTASLLVQVPIMITAAVLTDLVLGVAGEWLGDDLPPLAAVSFAAVFLYFDAGLNSRHFGYVVTVSLLGIGALWIYAVTQLMVSIGAVVVWSLLLVGLGVLAMLISRSVERDLRVQVDRQSSLLATLSDLG